MSTFELAIPVILKHEGGFVNNSADAGGATKYGISQRYLSDLFNKEISIDYIHSLSQNTAIQIYQSQWWDRYHYSVINDQALATKVFDLAVNMGACHAHQALQRACWSVKGRIINELKDDGILGEITINIVNSINAELLLPALRSEAAGYYRALHNPEFEMGWLKRVYDE